MHKLTIKQKTCWQSKNSLHEKGIHICATKILWFPALLPLTQCIFWQCLSNWYCGIWITQKAARSPRRAEQRETSERFRKGDVKERLILISDGPSKCCTVTVALFRAEVFHASTFLFVLSVLEKLNSYFCRFCRRISVWLKWDRSCKCLFWSPWKTLSTPHLSAALVNITPRAYFPRTANLKMKNLKLKSHSR